MKAEEFSERKATLSGWPVNVVSYRLGGLYHASVENVDPGAWVVKAQAATKAEAEASALREAEALLAKVSRKPPTGCTSVPGF